MNASQMIAEKDQQRLRREVLIWRVLDTLRPTVELRGLTVETPIDDVHLDFTDASARVIAPLVEAVDILESIIFASDGCVGHRECAHSMEPWQRARALLEGKWHAETYHETWPSSEAPLAASENDSPVDTIYFISPRKEGETDEEWGRRCGKITNVKMP